MLDWQILTLTMCVGIFRPRRRNHAKFLAIHYSHGPKVWKREKRKGHRFCMGGSFYNELQPADMKADDDKNDSTLKNIKFNHFVIYLFRKISVIICLDLFINF